METKKACWGEGRASLPGRIRQPSRRCVLCEPKKRQGFEVPRKWELKGPKLSAALASHFLADWLRHGWADPLPDSAKWKLSFVFGKGALWKGGGMDTNLPTKAWTETFCETAEKNTMGTISMTHVYGNCFTPRNLRKKQNLEKQKVAGGEDPNLGP